MGTFVVDNLKQRKYHLRGKVSEEPSNRSTEKAIKGTVFETLKFSHSRSPRGTGHLKRVWRVKQNR